jgi:hypothetical protein
MLGIFIRVGHYFTSIYSSNILYVRVVIYLAGFSCGGILLENIKKERKTSNRFIYYAEKRSLRE